MLAAIKRWVAPLESMCPGHSPPVSALALSRFVHVGHLQDESEICFLILGRCFLNLGRCFLNLGRCFLNLGVCVCVCVCVPTYGGSRETTYRLTSTTCHPRPSCLTRAVRSSDYSRRSTRRKRVRRAFAESSRFVGFYSSSVELIWSQGDSVSLILARWSSFAHSRRFLVLYSGRTNESVELGGESDANN